MCVLICDTHLIFSLSSSTIVIESEEICFSVIALVRHRLTALLVLKSTRVSSRLKLSIIWLRLLISSCIVLVESNSKIALSLIDGGRVVAFILLIIVILIVILVVLLRLRN
jgi:hypothetical protein